MSVLIFSYNAVKLLGGIAERRAKRKTSGCIFYICIGGQEDGRPDCAETDVNYVEEGNLLGEGVPLLGAEQRYEMQPLQELEPSSYNLLKEISTCSQGYGKVYLAQHHPTSQHLVIKVTQLDDTDDLCQSLRSVSLLREFRHPAIMCCLGAFVTSSELWSLHPVMLHGSAKDLLGQHFAEGLPESFINIILYSVLQALEYLHRNSYIHRAVRASHILLSTQRGVCLTGLQYGCSLISGAKCQKHIHQFLPNSKSNLNWMAPEILQQDLEGYNEKSDVYSVGMTALELATGSEPFDGLPPSLMLLEKLNGNIPKLNVTPNSVNGVKHNGLEDGEMVATAMGHFVALCTQVKATHRPSVTQLLSNSYLRPARRGNISLASLLSSVPSKIAAILHLLERTRCEVCVGYRTVAN